MTKREQSLTPLVLILSAVSVIAVSLVVYLLFGRGEWKPTGDGRTVVHTRTGEIRETAPAKKSTPPQNTTPKRERFKALRNNVRTAIVEFEEEMKHWMYVYGRATYDARYNKKGNRAAIGSVSIIEDGLQEWEDSKKPFMHYKDKSFDELLMECDILSLELVGLELVDSHSDYVWHTLGVDRWITGKYKKDNDNINDLPCESSRERLRKSIYKLEDAIKTEIARIQMESFE